MQDAKDYAFWRDGAPTRKAAGPESGPQCGFYKRQAGKGWRVAADRVLAKQG